MAYYANIKGRTISRELDFFSDYSVETRTLRAAKFLLTPAGYELFMLDIPNSRTKPGTVARAELAAKQWGNFESLPGDTREEVKRFI